MQIEVILLQWNFALMQKRAHIYRFICILTSRGISLPNRTVAGSTVINYKWISLFLSLYLFVYIYIYIYIYPYDYHLIICIPFIALPIWSIDGMNMKLSGPCGCWCAKWRSRSAKIVFETFIKIRMSKQWPILTIVVPAFAIGFIC